MKEISDSITRYYDSLTDEEIEEDRAWGEFAALQLAQTNWPDEDIPWAEKPQQDDSEQGS